MRAHQFIPEIEAMPQSQYQGGKKQLGNYRPAAKKYLQPLPGGTDLLYSVSKDSKFGGFNVNIVDPGTRPMVVGSLYLRPGPIPDSLQVGTITVDEDYRGQGLAKAMYGVVLTIMRKILVSGQSQTPGGRRNWLSMASIPGVEVQGLIAIPDYLFNNTRPWAKKQTDLLMQLGGQFVSQTNNYTYWTFDVVPGNGQLEPYIKNSLSKLYGYDADNLLMAKWTGA